MTFCKNHPEVPGIGICRRCGTVICAACRTRIEEINYCTACLQKLARSPRKPDPRLGSVFAGGIVLLAWILLFGLFWLLQGLLAP